MPRNKASKAKNKIKQKTKPSIVKSMSASMENDFRDLPKKLVAQISKEMNALKKDEKMHQSMLKKAQSQQKSMNDKHNKLLAKGNLTSSAKKQLNAIKKEQMHANKALNQLNKQMEQIKNQIMVLSNKNTKYHELSKLMTKLEKEIEAKMKKAPKKLPRATKKAKPEIINHPTAIQEPMMAKDGMESPMNESTTESVE